MVTKPDVPQNMPTCAYVWLRLPKDTIRVDKRGSVVFSAQEDDLLI